MKRALCILVLCAAVPAGSAHASAPPSLPFTTIAQGGVAPSAPGRAEALVSVRPKYVLIKAYAGRFPGGGYALDVLRVSIVRGQFQVRASLYVPPQSGESAPYEFIRIPRSAIHGRVPRSALLVQVETGLVPHTSPAHVLSTVAVFAGGRQLSATLVRNWSTLTGWIGWGALRDDVWYVHTTIGYFLLDDANGQIFGTGSP
jgi:hypothetical protein